MNTKWLEKFYSQKAECSMFFDKNDDMVFINKKGHFGGILYYISESSGWLLDPKNENDVVGVFFEGVPVPDERL